MIVRKNASLEALEAQEALGVEAMVCLSPYNSQYR